MLEQGWGGAVRTQTGKGTVWRTARGPVWEKGGKVKMLAEDRYLTYQTNEMLMAAISKSGFNTQTSESDLRTDPSAVRPEAT